MAKRTWKIRDQQPNGSWGPEREVTLAQFLAESKRKSEQAKAIFAANAARVGNDQA